MMLGITLNLRRRQAEGGSSQSLQLTHDLFVIHGLLVHVGTANSQTLVYANKIMLTHDLLHSSNPLSKIRLSFLKLKDMRVGINR